MNAFQKYAAHLSVSAEADVNINIDVNEATPTMTPVDPSTVVAAPAIEPAVDPLEGSTPSVPAIDPTASDVTEDVTVEAIPAEEPAASIDAAAQAEADAEDTPAPEEGEDDPAEETQEAEEDVALQEEEAAEEEAEEAEEKAEVIGEVKESLESIYETLASMESAGVTFDDGHAALTAIALNTAMGRIGGTAGSIVPSLESDNFFERTDLVASMEGIGAAIGAAAKAAGAAIMKAIRTAIEYLKKKFGKLGAIKTRFTQARAIAKKMPADKKVTVKFTSPGKDMSVFTALQHWEKYVKAIETSGRDLTKLHQFFQSNPLDASEESISVSQAGGRELDRMFTQAEDMIKRIERTDIIKQLEALESAYAALGGELDKSPTKTLLTSNDVAELRFTVGAMITFLDTFKVEAPAAA